MFGNIVGKSEFINALPTRRRKDSDNENDRQNGLRMKNEMTMKDKRFWHIAFCPTHKPTLRKSQRAKSC